MQPDGSPPDVNVWSTMDGELCAFSRSDGDRFFLHWPGVASFRFEAGGDTVTAVPYPRARPDIIRTTFYHSVLPLALQALGREGLHASAVLTPNGVVGFCGKAQTGKSTLAYALSRRGFGAWSDDALVWDREDEPVRAVRLPFEVRLRPPALSFYGYESLSDVPAPARNGVDRAPLAAVCVLTRAFADSAASTPRVAIEPLVGARALTTLLEHAHCFNPYDAPRKRLMLQNYFALLSRVPVFEVRFQPSLAFIPQLGDAILNAVAPRA